MHPVNWIYAEFDCTDEDVDRLAQEQAPKLTEVLNCLAGTRQLSKAAPVEFTYYYDEYVNDGFVRNLTRPLLDITLTIFNQQLSDLDGNILFDAKVEKEKQERRAIQENAERLIRQLNDHHLRRMLESFNRALGDEASMLSHLYAIRDAAKNKFGGESKAINTLGVSETAWSKFGNLSNNMPILGGRHSGNHSTPLRLMTDAERNWSIQFARTLIFALVRHLENQCEDAKDRGICGATSTSTSN